MTDDQTTTKQPAPVTGVHDRLSAMELALSDMRKEWDDAVESIKVLGDGVVDERDAPALLELAQSVGSILAKLGIVAATAVYTWQQVAPALGF